MTDEVAETGVIEVRVLEGAVKLYKALKELNGSEMVDTVLMVKVPELLIAMTDNIDEEELKKALAAQD